MIGAITFISQKSKLAIAICFALSRLARFLPNGRIELGNNIVERTIRPIALNLKNTLFAGVDEAQRMRRPSRSQSKAESCTISTRALI